MLENRTFFLPTAKWQMGQPATTEEFLHGGAAVIQKIRRDAVDGLPLPPSQRVILETRRDAGAAEADELIAAFQV